MIKRSIKSQDKIQHEIVFKSFRFRDFKINKKSPALIKDCASDRVTRDDPNFVRQT